MAGDELSPREVAERLGVTTRTVQRWIVGGRLPARRVGGRHRVTLAALEALAPGQAGTSVGAAGGQPERRIGTVLVANRGEIVARVARTARRLGIRVLATAVPDDRPPAGLDGLVEVPSYLDVEAIVTAARSAGADAVHPGYGFLAESPLFAARVAEAGLIWIGPPAAAIAAMGDKPAARRIAEAHGVGVLAGYDGDDQDEATLVSEATQIGFPLLVKAAAGGGGKGMRVVREAEQLADALAAARGEAGRAFGDDRLLLERYLDHARHVEIQILADQHGRAVHLGERDCSAQRRYQKVIEEAPAPSVDPDLRRSMGQSALAMAAAVGYVGAGTVEFLLAPNGAYFFIEMNTRLQVEHPVTELVTGRDLVADQLRIASGAPIGLEQSAIGWHGHAIEARLYAEDPEAGYLPQAGQIARLRWPEGAGVRVDTAIREGDLVSDRYDPMLAKVIAHGRDRAQALDRLRRALDETLVLGVRTNLRFLRWLLTQPVVRDAEMRTDTLAGLTLPRPPEPEAEAWRAAADALRSSAETSQWGGGWRINAAPRLRLATGELERSVSLEATVESPAPAVKVAGDVAHVDVEGQSLAFRLAPPPDVEEAARHAAGAEQASAALSAPMPGRVIAIRARQGEKVEAHAAVVVIEAMKMEHAVTAPASGRLSRLHVVVGEQVERGQLLAEVETR